MSNEIVRRIGRLKDQMLATAYKPVKVEMNQSMASALVEELRQFSFGYISVPPPESLEILGLKLIINENLPADSIKVTE